MEQISQETDRVRRNTEPQLLSRIDQTIEQNVRYYASQGPQAIAARLEGLEREWDMERVLGTNASILGLTGALLGLTSGRKWFLLPCIVTGFLLEHAISGWCPPVPLFRRLGIRTRSEIDREKFALKALRGDFRHLAVQPREPVAVSEVMRSVTA